MNILLVSFYYYPEIGAAPSRITNMAEGLKERGHEVDILTCLPNYPRGKIFEGYRGTPYKYEEHNGIHIYRYWSYATISKNPLLRAWGMVSFAMTLWSFAFKVKKIRNYDRVIIQSPPLPVASSALLLFKALYKKCTVVNISDLWPLSAVELGAMKEGSRICKIFGSLEKFIYRKSSAILGQSQEIVNHVCSMQPHKETFLYRNLSKFNGTVPEKERGATLKIVYAGLLGVAQDILGLIQQVNFKELGAEFHIYGNGNQALQIGEFIKNEDRGVYYHGFLSKDLIVQELSNYDVSLIPLTVRIKGAVPSKIFDVLPLGLPILFCGEGEGAQIIRDFKIGYVSPSGEYASLINNIKELKSLSNENYKRLVENCLQVSKNEFDFDVQMDKCVEFIKALK